MADLATASWSASSVKQKTARARRVPDDGCGLLVENLSPKTESDTLEQAFSKAGEVVSIDIQCVAGSYSADVEMESAEAAHRAIILLNNYELDGHQVRVLPVAVVTSPRPPSAAGLSSSISLLASSVQLPPNYDYVNPVDESLLCHICTEPMVDPVIVQCDGEHGFCASCVQAHFRRNGYTCPACREAVPEATATQRAPKLFARQLDALQVRCVNAKTGCTQSIARSDLAAHLAKCAFFVCPLRGSGCTWKGTAAALKDHHPKECGHVEVPCIFAEFGCAWLGERYQLAYHFVVGASLPLVQQCAAFQKLRLELAEEERARQEVLKRQQEEEVRKREREIERLQAQQAMREKRQSMACDWLNPKAEEMVTLFVGGSMTISCRIDTLCEKDDSVLARLFSDKHTLRRDNQGRVLLTCPPNTFLHIVNWLETGLVPKDLTGDERRMLKHYAYHLQLEELEEDLKDLDWQCVRPDAEIIAHILTWMKTKKAPKHLTNEEQRLLWYWARVLHVYDLADRFTSWTKS